MSNQHRNTVVTTNSFRILRLPTTDYVQYDVAINPDIPNARRRKELMLHLQSVSYPTLFQPRAIYDGKKILYSPKELPLSGGNTGVLEVVMGDGPKDKFEVKLSRSNVIGFTDLEKLIRGQKVDAAVPINLIQMLLRQAPSLLLPSKGRSVFSNTGGKDLGAGVIMLRGFFQSVRVVPNHVTVNVDVANSCFYKHGPLTDLALEVLGSRNARDLTLSPRDHGYDRAHNTLKRHFNRVQIKVPKVSNKIRTIRGLEPNAGLYNFEKEPGHFMTVEEYYREHYNIRLQRPRDFGVVLSPPKQQPKIVIPFELCEVLPGQPYSKKLSEFQTRDMVGAATQKPNERLQKICAAVGSQDGNILQYGRSDFLNTAGIRIDHNPMDVSGRMLAPPPIAYGGDRTSRADGGKWNMLGKRLFKPAPIADWCVINLSRLRQEQVQAFFTTLRSCCQELGMPSSSNANNVTFGSFNSASFKSWNDIRGAVMQTHRTGKPQLIIFILNKSDADTKARIKQFGDLMGAVVTQCLREDKFSRNLDPGRERALSQYCNNVALKINARLNGINCTMPLPGLATNGSDAFMIMGADVSHPSGGPFIDRPSVASLVYSVDPFGCQYQAQHAVLPPRTEVMEEDLLIMVKNAVRAYGHKNKKPVSRIIFYRDGVSEGEFETVAQREMAAIFGGVKSAFDEFVQNINSGLQQGQKPAELPPAPTMTFIIVTKRHHVRFFAKNPGDSDESSNLRAGFATDVSMCTPGLREFYLLSHGGLLGTSRPSHYIVLRDDNFNMNVPLIQELSFSLCHVYAKATRSVSIPAPVYYADLACTRASLFFDPALRFDQDDSTTEAKSNKQMRQDFDIMKWKNGFKAPSGDIAKSMYFI